MNVLLVSTFDISGGAARAAFRLHTSLLSEHADCKMLVMHKGSREASVIAPTSRLELLMSIIRSRLDRIPLLLYPNRSKTWFSTSWLPSFGFADLINRLDPDIVHLHWIYDGLIQIEELAKIKAPVVWSMHDMWAFTGGCHYDEECGKYLEVCGCCPVLRSSRKHDLSNSIFRRKSKVYGRLNFNIVGMSRWIAECAGKSTLLRSMNVFQLPNPVDTNVFSPIPREQAKKNLNLPASKKIILFGAMNATDDPRKGFRELSESLQRLPHIDAELGIFGAERSKQVPEFRFPVHYFGRLNDDISLRNLYCAADMVVVPSRQENLSNVIMESMACGTPVVGFDIGGNSDMITHLENGYLARPYDAEDLATGIKWILENPQHKMVCLNAREKMLREFDNTVVARRYLSLYKKILRM